MKRDELLHNQFQKCDKKYALLNLFYVVFIISIFFAGPGFTATFYMDIENGSDSNSGNSPLLAWQNISKINSYHFQPGDSILFKQGQIWRDRLWLTISGTESAPIVFSSYGSGVQPIISGADAVDSLKYSWHVSSSGTNEYYITQKNGAAPQIPQPLLVWLEGQNLEPGQAGSLNDLCWSWADNDGLGFQTLYFRDNRGTPVITSSLMETANRNNSIVIGDAAYLTFHNIDFQQSNATWGGVVHVYDSHHINFIQCKMHEGYYACFYAYYSDAEAPHHILIDQCQIYGNRRTDSVYGAVMKFDGCNTNTIQNSTIYESNNATLSDVIFVYNSDDNVFYQNDIYGPAGNLLYIKEGSDNNRVSYNKFHDSMGGMGIQVRVNANNNHIFYNLIYNMEGGPSIQSDGDVPIDGTKIYNNTIYTTGNNRNGISIHNTNTNCEVKNNIVFVGEYSFALHVAPNSRDGVDIDYNLFRNISGNLISWNGNYYTMNQFSDYQQASGLDSHSITNDPQFINPEEANFQLQPGSPCIDLGTNIGLLYDLRQVSVPWGGNIDLGVFEFVDDSLQAPQNLRVFNNAFY